ncbi:hypothetical protein HOLleu_31907 [Holothuria leucospilota]|uniref:Uncharacterized protein n=1 Tax=Holothuria leucospilota TaxID=206669 RepID=A0A9Q0YQW6_HOLLE|nr:hypothetical protein HOLleu_31907 [Holothuria leucospilota]
MNRLNLWYLLLSTRNALQHKKPCLTPTDRLLGSLPIKRSHISESKQLITTTKHFCIFSSLKTFGKAEHL